MPYSYNLGKRLFKLPEAGKRQRGRPLKVKSGLRGRPKILPSGTMEWLRQSLNNDVFFFIKRKKKTSHKHGGGESSFLGCFAFALL